MNNLFRWILFLQITLPLFCLLHTALPEDQCQILRAQVAGVPEFKTMLAEVPLCEGE